MDGLMGPRVLLAEDEPNIVVAITFILERAGFEVTTRTDGRQALSAALNDPPDVVILDVSLPELDGLDALRMLRADPRGQGVPVIVLTAKGRGADRDSALDSGADLYLTKPFSNAELIAAVRRVTGVAPD